MDTLTYKLVTIRKPRKCYFCNDQYQIGQKLFVHESVDQGDFYRSYGCLPCQIFLEKSRDDFQDGVAEGEFKHEEYYQKFKTMFLQQNQQNCQCDECRDSDVIHESGCVVHNEPAEPKGECNCQTIRKAHLIKPGNDTN